MTYEVVGIKTKRVYASGSRPDCMRSLNKNFPYVSSKMHSAYRTVNAKTIDAVLDEPLRIIRR